MATDTLDSYYVPEEEGRGKARRHLRNKAEPRPHKNYDWTYDRFSEKVASEILQVLVGKHWALYPGTGLSKEEIVLAGQITTPEQMIKGQGYYLLPRFDPTACSGLERDPKIVLGCLEQVLAEWHQKPPTIPAFDGKARFMPTAKKILLPMLCLRPNNGSITISGKNPLGVGSNKEETIFYKDLFLGLDTFPSLSQSRMYQAYLVSRGIQESPRTPLRR